MKRFCLIGVLMLCHLLLHAQAGFYQPFSIGAGYGVTIAKAGEQTLTSSNASLVNLAYQLTPFFSLNLEGQFGKLTGGNAQQDVFTKQFTNSYNAAILHADLQLGELIDYSNDPLLNGIKNFYAGTGLGFLSNKVNHIQTVQRDSSFQTVFTYLPSSTNFMIPLRMGYEFKIFNNYNEPQYRFDINYTLNTVFGTGLDGYVNPYSSSVKYYNYISVSFKLGFGKTRPYRKAVFPSYF